MCKVNGKKETISRRRMRERGKMKEQKEMH